MTDAQPKFCEDFDILQIVPAVGWKAVYSDHTERLSCWALIEFDNEAGGREREVVGMVCGREGSVNAAFKTPHFARYAFAPG